MNLLWLLIPDPFPPNCVSRYVTLISHLAAGAADPAGFPYLGLPLVSSHLTATVGADV